MTVRIVQFHLIYSVAHKILVRWTLAKRDSCVVGELLQTCLLFAT